MGLYRKSGTLRATLVVVAVFALTLTTCGGKKRHTPPTLPWLSTDAETAAPQISRSAKTNADTLMERLTAALAEVLEARGGKVTAAPATGEGNLIVDLHYVVGGVGGNRLVWHYRNLGDYNQSGTVGIGDLTSLAMHFGETIAENPLVEVIDGDLDGAAGIGDVQAIAENYRCTVAGYIIESAAEEHGEYAEVGSVEFASATGGDEGWKELVFALPTGDALWYWVVPVDAAGARGIASLPVQFRSPSAAPRVTAVSPLIGEPDAAVRFAATVEGEEPFDYYWYFGDAGTPSSSTDAEPLVLLQELGRHVCRVQVSNAHGQHTYFFAVLVTPAVYPPFIERVWPTTAVTNTQVQFFSQVFGTEPMEYHWDFGGGAFPDETDDAWPEVVVGDAGEYACELTVTNGAGSDSREFTLDVSLGQRGDWWMFGREPTHNRRSPYVGAQDAVLKWRYYLAGGGERSNPAIGEDGTIHVGSPDGYLYALNPDGSIKWRWFDCSGLWMYPSPAIGADGTIYVGNSDNYLCAVNPDGTLLWRYRTLGQTNSSPAIDANGIIYVGSRDYNIDSTGEWICDGYLYSIRPDGTYKWRYKTGGRLSISPAIGGDGTIYVGSGDGFLYALYPSGGLKWRYETEGGVSSSPAIGADGTVYVGSDDDYLYAINPDGTLKWRYETGDYVRSSPAIGSDGTIYVGSYDNHLYAINSDGTLKWLYEMGEDIYSSPAIGADGTVYVGSNDHYFYAVNPDGTLKWRYETGSNVRSSPAIGADGTVYVGSDDHYLYAFHHESPPVIVSVSPAVGNAGKVVEFTAKMWGTPPFSYYWNFGGGAWPNTSNDPSPAVTMCESGVYDASLTVTNSYGADTYQFELASVDLTPPGDWYMFGREPRRNRRSPYVGAQTSTLDWKYDTGNRLYSSPAIDANGTVYVGSLYGYLYAVNSDGTLRWRYANGIYVTSSPAIGADGTVYVGSGDNYVYAIYPSGILRWRYKTNGWVHSSPAISDDGTVYVGSHDGRIYAIAINGTLKWRYYTSWPVYSSPAIGVDGTVYAAGWDLYAFDPDGTVKWRFETDDDINSSPAIGADGTIYVGSNDHYFYAVNPDGTLKWRYETGGRIESSSAIGDDGIVYVGSADNYLYALNPDGTLFWRYETGDDVYSSPAIGADGTVYIGSYDGWIYAIDADGKLKWCYETDAKVYSSPAISENGAVYIGSHDGYLYAFKD